jgi:hypothetical protein
MALADKIRIWLAEALGVPAGWLTIDYLHWIREIKSKSLEFDSRLDGEDDLISQSIMQLIELDIAADEFLASFI